MPNSQISNSSILSSSSVNPWLHNKLSIGEAFECEMDDTIVVFETAVDLPANSDLQQCTHFSTFRANI